MARVAGIFATSSLGGQVNALQHLNITVFARNFKLSKNWVLYPGGQVIYGSLWCLQRSVDTMIGPRLKHVVSSSWRNAAVSMCSCRFACSQTRQVPGRWSEQKHQMTDAQPETFPGLSPLASSSWRGKTRVFVHYIANLELSNLDAKSII